MKILLALIGHLLISLISFGQVTLTKSNLPIVIINTNGQFIDDEPKIMADMKIIYNGPNVENSVLDNANEYNGKIGIETRGSTSQMFPKLPFGLETLDINGTETDVRILGMPKESDWILNPSYNDKSLMRDGLAYILAGSIMEYSPRVRYTELVINQQYQGIYLLQEKIKRNKNRVNIEKMSPQDNASDALTGGYIIKLDKETGTNSGQGWNSTYKPFPNAWQSTFFQYEYPKPANITGAQKTYIKQFFDNFEAILDGQNFANPQNGFRKYIDTTSLINYIIINELAKNPDAYRLSTFMYKDRDSKGGKLKFGPVWDFNLGFGNVDYCTQGNPEGLVIEDFNNVCGQDGWVIHFWWQKFLKDETFYYQLKQNWHTLRQKQLSNDRILYVIDSISTLLNQAQKRNFTQWPILGHYVWPNYFIGATYDSEVSFLKNWILNRLAYLDKVWKIKTMETNSKDKFCTIFPNPSTNIVNLNFKQKIDSLLNIDVMDHCGNILELGQKIKSENSIELDISSITAGVYYLKMEFLGSTYTYSLVKI
jgi:hypothetical protein